jgi:spore germination protein YaaH
MVSDFEGFKGDTLKLAYNAFLAELKTELVKTNKKLYVAVHPKRKPGQAYFDGYDYKTIGELADKVILMAHDYDAVSLTDDEMLRGYTDTPVTPFDEVYYALKSITDPVSGVQDLNKLWLQLSMDTVQWKLKDGKVINSIPYHPSYSQLIQRFLTGVKLNYSEYSQNPYAVFFNNEDVTNNVIWYENQRSIAEKIKLAKLFGIKGLSLWRLGNIPEQSDTPEVQIELDIWNEIIKNY